MTIGRLGVTEDRTKKLIIDKQRVIQLDGSKDAPTIHDQLVSKITAISREEGIRPENLALDSTSEGDAICSMLKREFGPVIGVEFGGKATAIPVSDNDRRHGYERFQNRVSELWYKVRDLLITGKIHGVPLQARKEFCLREYRLRGKKIMVEKKSDLKQRLKCSPDHADSVVILVDLAVSRGLSVGKGTESGTQSQTWKRAQRRSDSLYDDKLAQEVHREELLIEQTNYRYSRYNPKNRRRYAPQLIATYQEPGH
jgi:hypothetical protein